MADWQKDRIASALRGENPTVLMRLQSGFAVFGDTQLLPGYCVLLAYLTCRSTRSYSRACAKACARCMPGPFRILRNHNPIHANIRCSYEQRMFCFMRFPVGRIPYADSGPGR